MCRLSITLGNDTVSSTTWVSKRTVTAWGRSSSPFRDYADRDLGSPRFLHMQCLLACRVKFLNIARFVYDAADGTESPILAFPGLL